jgi:hypothetical protein
MDRSPLSAKGRSFLALIMRSPDLGDGWRSVSTQVWPLVEAFEAQDLIEKGNLTVRLSEKGQAVAQYV